MRFPKDVDHLLRLTVLAVTGILAFLGYRALAVPSGFGQYGHYRGPALNEIRRTTFRMRVSDVRSLPYRTT